MHLLSLLECLETVLDQKVPCVLAVDKRMSPEVNCDCILLDMFHLLHILLQILFQIQATLYFMKGYGGSYRIVDVI